MDRGQIGRAFLYATAIIAGCAFGSVAAETPDAQTVAPQAIASGQLENLIGSLRDIEGKLRGTIQKSEDAFHVLQHFSPERHDFTSSLAIPEFLRQLKTTPDLKFSDNAWLGIRNALTYNNFDFLQSDIDDCSAISQTMGIAPPHCPAPPTRVHRHSMHHASGGGGSAKDIPDHITLFRWHWD